MIIPLVVAATAFLPIEIVCIGGWGVSPYGKSFGVVPCVRACARSACLEELDRGSRCHPFPFPFMGRRAFPFLFLGRLGFPFPFLPPPKPPIQL